MRRAFTLIELLVVIAIIAILAAILFPVFAQAKAAAKKTADLNNQKQMNLGVQIYLSDNDDTFPLTVPGNLGTSFFTMPSDRTPSANPGFRQAFPGNSLQPYIKNWGLYTGPGASTDWNPFGAQTPTPVVSTSYTMNPYLQSWSATSSPAPAHTVVYWDGFGNIRIPGYGICWPLIVTKDLGFLQGTGAAYHFSNSGPSCTSGVGVFTGTEGTGGLIRHNSWGKGDNMTYADGHAKFVHFGGADYPWIVDDQGYDQQYWVDTDDSAAGCGYSYTLNPMIAQ